MLLAKGASEFGCDASDDSTTLSAYEPITVAADWGTFETGSARARFLNIEILHQVQLTAELLQFCFLIRSLRI